MKVHHALPERRRRSAPFVVAIGFFDGFHRGHRAIVRERCGCGAPANARAVLTFREHPAAFLRPGRSRR